MYAEIQPLKFLIQFYQITNLLIFNPIHFNSIQILDNCDFISEKEVAVSIIIAFEL